MCKKQGGTLPYALLILLQSVLYGFGNPLSKIGFESITVLWCLGIRFFGAAAVMLLLFGRRTVRTLRAAPLKAWLPCSLAMAAAYASCNLALEYTTATNVGFLMSLPVLFTPALARLVLKRPYPKGVIPIQLAVIAGPYLLCCGGESGSFIFGIGEVLGLVCALSLAAALVFSEGAMPGIDPVSMAAAQARSPACCVWRRRCCSTTRRCCPMSPLPAGWWWPIWRCCVHVFPMCCRTRR